MCFRGAIFFLVLSLTILTLNEHVSSTLHPCLHLRLAAASGKYESQLRCPQPVLVGLRHDFSSVFLAALSLISAGLGSPRGRLLNNTCFSCNQVSHPCGIGRVRSCLSPTSQRRQLLLPRAPRLGPTAALRESDLSVRKNSFTVYFF